MHRLFVIRSRVQRAMLMSIAAALATIVLKFGAWMLTGSVGLYSDAMESLVNLTAAVLGFILLGLAALPADEDHPFGHEKAEYFASGAEGMLILMAAASIAWEAIHGFMKPPPLQRLDFGLLLSLLATGVNGAAAWWLMRVAHREKSLAVEADAHHLLTDVWTSVGVLVALGLLLIFPKAWWLDPVIALAVAGNIVFTGLHLMRHSINGLMDLQLPPAEFKAIIDALRQAMPANTELNGLRTRKAGNRRFVEFNLLVPGQWTVHEGHILCDTLEAAIRGVFAETEILIHVEPTEDFRAEHPEIA
ncbi:MAG TPA: cation diffusion facilitator family transporter [Moraxellaceae bacterium]|nr:cation diffusion facilitator family transporter [Moraxellaceae bacterium]